MGQIKKPPEQELKKGSDMHLDLWLKKWSEMTQSEQVLRGLQIIEQQRFVAGSQVYGFGRQTDQSRIRFPRGHVTQFVRSISFD